MAQAIGVSRHPDFKGDYRDLIATVSREMAAIINEHGIYENSRGDVISRNWWTFMRVEDEVAADRLLRKISVAELAAHPTRFMRSGMLNLAGFWFRGPSKKSTFASAAMHLPLLLLAAIGAVAALRAKQDPVWLLMLIIAYFNFTAVASTAFVRYSLPVIPVAILLAASGIETLRSWILGQGPSSPREYC